MRNKMNVVYTCSVIWLGVMLIAVGNLYAAEAVRNVSPLATITASARSESAGAVADGKIPFAGSRDDLGQVWLVGQADLPATLTFEWDAPATVDTIVYYGRTTWGPEPFKDYEVYVDDGREPVITGSFKRGHGPQLAHLPQPVNARKLTLKFLSGDGNPGAAEVQIFNARPSQEDLLCRFTDFSMDFRYAYFPSHNLMRVFVPKPPADAKTWHVALQPADGGGIIAEKNGTLPMAAAGENLEVPELSEGNYMLTLTLTPADGGEPVIEERSFSRRHFEWEGLGIGSDDVVVPPFEPLTAGAATSLTRPPQTSLIVTSVLREHVHNGVGLWEQVVSQGRPLLAGPVRLEVSTGGRTIVAEGNAPTFDTVKETKVAGHAEWSAGPLAGRTDFEYDYDGFKLLTLHLSPTDEEIERLQLVIPLRASEAWLMHPVTDTLRHHYAGRIPEGDGKVWDSLKVSRQALPGPFVPYIYVGGPERGICYAADNDRDWIISRDQAAIEIDRDGGTVNLRLNLIARPAKLTRERSITFALQATPAKPMPEEPYNWRRWWATGTPREIDDVQINFWGANMYWGGRYFATSVYPAFKDYAFWEQLAKQRREGKFDTEYFNKWMERFADAPPDQLATFRAHFQAGLQWSAGTPANTPQTTKFRYLIPYTNARGCSAESEAFFSTYIDEWLNGDVADPQWHRYSNFQRPTRLSGWGCWYEIEPVDTYIDRMVFYHQKMLETFADGIYWDNFFLRASYVPAEAGGPGYIDDDGNLRAGVNLMAFRKFVKRTATMMHQMGKRPVIYIHMTNTTIVPMLSFATLNLDWEWRDQGKFALMDLQDRLGSDTDTALILAHNLGLQAGNISVGIDRFNPPRDSGVTREWLFRTVMAVCFPHEIKVHQGTRDVSNVQAHLARFGYGTPECKVYRYWEEGHPLQAEGANTHALVLANDGRAMLAIGNYGPGDEPQIAPAESAGPTLEEYDAGQRGEARAADDKPADAAQEKHEMYTVTLTLDLETLGLKDSVRAYDVENNRQELERVEPGVFRLTMRKHDFALVVVE